MRWIAILLITVLLPGCITPDPQSRGVAACRLMVTDYGNMHVQAITAESVSIYLDRTATLRVDEITANQVETHVDGYAGNE